MKKTIHLLIALLVVVIGQVAVSCETKNETKPSKKTLTMAEKKANLKKKKQWKATPDGMNFKEWQASPEGKKVQASYEKIKKSIKAFSKMEAVITSVTFQRSGKSSEIKWLIVSIDDEEYMMQFTPKEFQKLNSLKVNDTIILKSRSAGLSPNHPYLIVSGDYIEHNNTMLFKRDFKKMKGC